MAWSCSSSSSSSGCWPLGISAPAANCSTGLSFSAHVQRFCILSSSKRCIRSRASCFPVRLVNYFPETCSSHYFPGPCSSHHFSSSSSSSSSASSSSSSAFVISSDRCPLYSGSASRNGRGACLEPSSQGGPRHTNLVLVMDASQHSSESEEAALTAPSSSSSSSASSSSSLCPEAVRRPGGGGAGGSQLELRRRRQKKREEPVDARQIFSNAHRAAAGGERPSVRHTIGVDYGTRRTGTAVSYKGLAPRPNAVLTSQGLKLASELLEIARQEEADEFVVGLPVFARGQESEQAKKVRAFASILSNHAAERGWRVYLQTEFNSSRDALEYMIITGSNQRSRRKQLDAYAAMIILQQYFEDGGSNAELLLPKSSRLQRQLLEGPRHNKQPDHLVASSKEPEDDDDNYVYDVDIE